MSAISGIWAPGAGWNARAACALMLDAQRDYGATRDADCAEDLALGRNLHPILPEDEFDRQPLSGGEGRFRMVADLRIDNRDALIAELGVGPVGKLADSALLMKAWERWGEKVLDRLSGDFAFALWDRAARTLYLARDPTGQRPLHYHRRDGLFAFSSMPAGLLALPGIDTGLDEAALARQAGGGVIEPDQTFFRAICSIPTGHLLAVNQDGLRTSRYWDPPVRTLRLRSDRDYEEALRERIDRAVRVRLRGAGSKVGSHLSAGYDSSVVTATAARLMQERGGQVLACTSAPRAGFEGQVGRALIADESQLAAMTAAHHGNVEHVVIRGDAGSPLTWVEAWQQQTQYPLVGVANSGWWNRINREAGARGCRVMLTGQLGNFSISAGNLALFADLIREGRLIDWAREARLLVKAGGVRWTGVIANSWGPWVPAPIWRRIGLATGHISPMMSAGRLVRPHWRALAESKGARGRYRPVRDSYAARLRILQRFDVGIARKASLALWGIDERDPTADRELIEFCLSLPTDQLLKNGVSRPLLRRTVADRLPPEMLQDRPRGIQTADWYEGLGREALLREVEEVDSTPLAASIIDTQVMRAMADNWPQDGWSGRRDVLDYRIGLLGALAVARFIRAFAPAAQGGCSDTPVRAETAA